MTTEQAMAGKICMVTGATSGIGEVTARELARLGATLIVVGRSQAKSAATVEQIKRQTGNPAVEYMLADLSLIAEVRKLAQQFQSKYQQLHVLVNNAGAVLFKSEKTSEGLAVTFALNHLNYFLLTNLLLDTIKASAPARIINVSSSAHQPGKINFDRLQEVSGLAAYAQSKLANVLFTYELARRLENSGVTVNALHPGVVASNFGSGTSWISRLIMPLVRLRGISPEKGAETSIYLASSPAVEGVSGKYFYKKQPVATSKASYDEAVAKRLWDVNAELTGLDKGV